MASVRIKEIKFSIRWLPIRFSNILGFEFQTTETIAPDVRPLFDDVMPCLRSVCHRLGLRAPGSELRPTRIRRSGAAPARPGLQPAPRGGGLDRSTVTDGRGRAPLRTPTEPARDRERRDREWPSPSAVVLDRTGQQSDTVRVSVRAVSRRRRDRAGRRGTPNTAHKEGGKIDYM